MNIEHMLNEVITYASLLSRDSRGKPTYDSQATAPARINRTKSLVNQGQSGQVLTTNINVGTTIEFKNDDVIWLPGDDTSKSGREVKAVTQGTNLANDLTIWIATL